MTRQIVLDTETTGLEVTQGNRIVEIGCVELKHRRATGSNFHRYVNPDREMEPGAQAVHGISLESLQGKPRFHELAQELWDYLAGAELLIHNASFDMAYLEMEFARAGCTRKLAEVCTVIDTLGMARKLHPGQKNRLDDLCKRYAVDNSQRDFHGALLDAQLLADVYLAMTGGQNKLSLDPAGGDTRRSRFLAQLGTSTAPLAVVAANAEELAAHTAKLKKMGEKGKLIWQDGIRDT